MSAIDDAIELAEYLAENADKLKPEELASLRRRLALLTVQAQADALAVDSKRVDDKLS